MRKIIVSWLVAGILLFILSIAGLYATIWFFPDLSMQYFNPGFEDHASRYRLYFIHPFIISFALAWFWNRFKDALRGPSIIRGVEFGLTYVGIAIIPMMWMLYSTLNVSLEMLLTWTVFALLQAVIAGMVFQKLNK